MSGRNETIGGWGAGMAGWQPPTQDERIAQELAAEAFEAERLKRKQEAEADAARAAAALREDNRAKARALGQPDPYAGSPAGAPAQPGAAVPPFGVLPPGGPDDPPVNPQDRADALKKQREDEARALAEWQDAESREWQAALRRDWGQAQRPAAVALADRTAERLSPAWENDGSLGQIGQDAQAKALLDQLLAAENQRVDAMAAANDPQARDLEARKVTAGIESLMRPTADDLLGGEDATFQQPEPGMIRYRAPQGTSELTAKSGLLADAQVFYQNTLRGLLEAGMDPMSAERVARAQQAMRLQVLLGGDLGDFVDKAPTRPVDPYAAVDQTVTGS